MISDSFVFCNKLYAFSSDRIDVQRPKTTMEFVFTLLSEKMVIIWYLLIWAQQTMSV